MFLNEATAADTPTPAGLTVALHLRMKIFYYLVHTSKEGFPPQVGWHTTVR